jgi:CDP-paratose 2-epimerase
MKFARAVDRIDAAAGQVFNVGGGPANTMSLRELVAKLERAFERKLDPPHAAWRPGDQRVFVADVRKAERVLGWRPSVSTDEGVARLIDWVKENQSLFGAGAVGPASSSVIRHKPSAIP